MHDQLHIDVPVHEHLNLRQMSSTLSPSLTCKAQLSRVIIAGSNIVSPDVSVNYVRGKLLNKKAA